MSTPIDVELDGAPFAEPVEIAEMVDVDDYHGYVQVLRNGAVLADSSVVGQHDDAASWWRQRPS